MTDDEEFAARSQLKWQRDGYVWILLYRRKRMGRVVPDKDHPGMWRSVKSNGLSDTANLYWAKDAVLAQAVRELLDCGEHYPPMPEQHADVLEVLIGQMTECRETNPVFSKAPRILGHAEFFEPVCNLLHRRAAYGLNSIRSGPAQRKVYHTR